MDIITRLELLEKRVAELEEELAGWKSRYPDKPPGSQTAEKHFTSPVPAAPPAYVPPSGQPDEKDKMAERDWEHLIAKVWLPRVFMFVLLVGLIWGFKAAVDGGYLTEGMRCILGYLVGGIFVYLGFRQHKEKRPLLSQALLGGSVGVLMLTTFAAHYLYGFVNAPVAFVLNVLWVILGLRFSAKFHSQALGVLASAAGVLTPFLVQSDNPSSIFFVSFETILFVGFMTFAMRFDFEKLFYTSFALLHVALVFYGFAAGRDEEIIALGALAQHFILLASIFVQRNWMKLQLMALVTSFALTAVWFRIAMSSFWFENTMLLIFVAYAFLSLWFWKKDTEKLPYCLTVASYAVLFYTSAIVDHESLPAILLLEGLVALGLGFAVKSGIQKINGLIIYMIGGIGALVVLSEGMDEIFSSNMLIWLTLLLTLAGIAGLLSKFRLGGKTNERVKGLYYGIGALFLAFITDLTNALTHNLSNNAQHLSVSTAWVAYSIGVIAYGVMGSRKKVRLAGIALLFLTLMKVIFFDLPSVSVVIKAILFIGLGGIGVLLSRFFYKKE